MNNITINSKLLGWSERPKEQAKLDFKSPESTREYAVWGSDQKTDILLALAAISPQFDNTIDATTLLPITLFRGSIDVQLEGAGTWTAHVHYQSSQSTIEVAFTLGVTTTKIYQALKDVASYSCLGVPSVTAQALAAATTNYATDVTTAQTAYSAATAALVTAAQTAARAAVTAANAAGVDPAVKAQTLAAAVATGNVAAASIALVAAAGNAVTATNATVTALNAGNATTAATQAGNAQTYATVALNAANAMFTSDNAGVAAANNAGTLAAGGNAATVNAAAAATAAANAASAVYNASSPTALADTINLATQNASGCAEQAVLETQPGTNVPDFQGAIGVNGDQVEGCEIEVGKVELSITKKWPMGVLSADYFITLAQMTDRCVVNDAPFSFQWMDQVLTFEMGTLRFRGAPIKWSSQGELEITYYIAFSRPILASDNFTIGKSPVITKLGHEYLWTRYQAVPSAGTTALQPLSVHVNQVYPFDDFGKLQLDL